MSRKAILLFALVGCSPEENTDSGTDSATSDSGSTGEEGCETPYGVSWDNWGDGFFLTYCRSCHSETTADRNEAPEGVDFEDEDDLVNWAPRIRVRVLEDMTMPVGGGVYEDDLVLLEALLTCLP